MKSASQSDSMTRLILPVPFESSPEKRRENTVLRATIHNNAQRKEADAFDVHLESVVRAILHPVLLTLFLVVFAKAAPFKAEGILSVFYKLGSAASGTHLRYDTSDRQKTCPLLSDKLPPRGILFAKGVDNIAFLCYNLSW